MSAFVDAKFAGTVIAVLGFAAVVGIMEYLLDQDTRDYYKSLLEEWRRKGGGR